MLVSPIGSRFKELLAGEGEQVGDFAPAGGPRGRVLERHGHSLCDRGRRPGGGGR
ncbi:hypothetical protein SGFS_056060 [Streptomyces graminofaciens]|uniref:Uncharacterized protein n=1 Tax=Streptomyces graminofaciens TaxID=68212 RepID=A0ABM7FDS6_9ACTN|nr:hypothetical protein SGFS_056060 [Streptomyces graminofaciens]